jgi:hypothetical protein
MTKELIKTSKDLRNKLLNNRKPIGRDKTNLNKYGF